MERAIADITQALQVARQDGETPMVFPHLLVQAVKRFVEEKVLQKPEREIPVLLKLGMKRRSW